MQVLSLFDGISCARIALEKAGISVEEYYSSETDKYAIQIAQKNYPDTIQLGDIRTIGNGTIARLQKKMICEIDLIIGGSPCQDLSIAKNNREGLKGARSGLFWEYVRILREIKPKFFILENVASMSKEAKKTITDTLRVEPIMINATLVSAQNRKRLFWTNIPNVKLPDDRGVFLKDILEPKVDDVFTVKPKSNTIRSSGRGSGIDDKHNWDTIRIGIINKGGQGDRIYSPVQRKKKGLFITQKSAEADNASNCKNNISITDDDEYGSYIIRKLTPVECERLQSLPDNYTAGVSNTQRYKCLGNAFNVDVVAHILKYFSIKQLNK